MIAPPRSGWLAMGLFGLALGTGFLTGRAPAADARRPPEPAAAPADPAATGESADALLAKLLPPRTDSPLDWQMPLEPLHRCGEPRFLPACVPPPPCHPSLPPAPFDLVGRRGSPSRGPLYAGPCCPRTGSHDHECLPRAHGVWDRWFDLYYRAK